jgi:hypothetical protein
MGPIGLEIARLCAEFGISRKTGYKIYDRYKDGGVPAFNDRSRRPHRQANRLPAPIEATIVRLKREYPGWGAPKIREKLRKQELGPQLPAISTVHAVLDRHGLVKRRRRRRHTTGGTALSRPTEPNVLWCADYKGEFMLGNRRYCYPLTITDFASRYLLTCERCRPRRRSSRSPCSNRPSGVWAAAGHPHRQRRAVRVRARALWAEQIVGLVAAAGDQIERRNPDTRRITAATSGCI